MKKYKYFCGYCKNKFTVPAVKKMVSGLEIWTQPNQVKCQCGNFIKREEGEEQTITRKLRKG